MPHDPSLLPLRNLKLEAGTVVFAGRDDSPALLAASGQSARNLPPRTIVKMALSPAEGSYIRVELWLPDPETWNGRFVGLGNGGSAGSIHTLALAEVFSTGCATATTDMGTSRSGVGNPEVWKDFGFRATHLMTVAAKQAVEAYYGKPPAFSYFSGVSTGGQQGLQEAQRYPGDYDGIVAGVPAHCRTPLHAYFLWNAQILCRCPFTESQQKRILEAGLAFRASREPPALAGKAISDPRRTPEDIEAVLQLALDRDPSLTQEQAAALRKLFDGPRHAATGERVFNGIPFGTSFAEAQANLYLFHWVFGEHRNLLDLNFGGDLETYTAALGPYLNAENPDLRPFAGRGGKILMYSGTADACVPYHATIEYYERVAECLGGLDKVLPFFRFFLVPGRGHGAGPVINRLPNLLEAVVDWRENGLAPEGLQAQQVVEGRVELDLPVYPYPAQTTWNAQAARYQQVGGPRHGVEPIAARFRPPAATEEKEIR
jgi:feruloyl esterase